MTRQQLIDALKAQNQIQPAALIRYRYDLGIAMLLGENLGKPWMSGDLIIFWADGDHTDVGADQEVTWVKGIYD